MDIRWQQHSAECCCHLGILNLMWKVKDCWSENQKLVDSLLYPRFLSIKGITNHTHVFSAFSKTWNYGGWGPCITWHLFPAKGFTNWLLILGLRYSPTLSLTLSVPSSLERKSCFCRGAVIHLRFIIRMSDDWCELNICNIFYGIHLIVKLKLRLYTKNWCQSI